MNFVIYVLIAVIVLLATFAVIHLRTQLKVVNRLMEVNKQLILLTAGKEAKPEALRALVASEKPPQGKLRGIATGKKKDEKRPANTNYALTIGENNAL